MSDDTILSKSKKIYNNAYNSLNHTTSELNNFFTTKLPEKTKEILGKPIKDIGDHLGRNWAAYGGAGAIAAGLGAYKLRQKMKEKKRLEGMK